MSHSRRTTSFSLDEDIYICRAYLNVSQNPIICINQSKDQLWSRIEGEYNTKPVSITQYRSKRSLQSRWHFIVAEIEKLRGFVRQVENRHPSGASEQDIMYEAKMLYLNDE